VSLRWRVISVGLLLAVFTFLTAANFVPKEQRIESEWLPDDLLRMGLDLRGGIHWVVGVDLDTAVEREIATLAAGMRSRLEDDEITGVLVTQQGARLLIEASGPDAEAALASLLDDYSVLRRVGEVFVLGIGEATFYAGEDELPPDAKAVLSGAAGLVKSSPGARIELIPKIMYDDLEALQIERSDRSWAGAIRETGRALFGTGAEHEGEDAEELNALAQRRVDSVARYLGERGLAGRIRPQPWDKKIYTGIPRVMLRMRIRADSDE
jgi:outer membrane protein OmpA-like peptidoglycan-associated protein